MLGVGFSGALIPSPSVPLQAGTRDVVYAYTPSTDVAVDISTCGSLFDTVLYVVEDPNNLQVLGGLGG